MFNAPLLSFSTINKYTEFIDSYTQAYLPDMILLKNNFIDIDPHVESICILADTLQIEQLVARFPSTSLDILRYNNY